MNLQNLLFALTPPPGMKNEYLEDNLSGTLITGIIIASILLIILFFISFLSKRKHFILKIVLSTFICFSIVFVAVRCSREVNPEDVNINLSPKLSLNTEFTVIPNCNIDNLEITFYFTDSNQSLDIKKVKNLGNVKKGNTYTVVIQFTEFEFSEIFKITRTSAIATRGSISYWQ